jgi:hypothetical protein
LVALRKLSAPQLSAGPLGRIKIPKAYVMSKENVFTRFKNNPPGNRLQKFSSWATIFGSIISVILAGITIYLTNELDKTDRKVDLLEKIAQKQDTTNKDMLMLIRQNETTIGKLNEQVKLTNDQYSLARNAKLIENQKELVQFSDLSNEFDSFVNEKIILPKNKVLNSPINIRTELVNKLSNQINNILKSPIVFTVIKHKNAWTKFHFEFIVFKYHMENIPPIDSIDNGQEGKHIKEDFIKSFDTFISEFRKFDDSMSDFAIEWQLKNTR